ncbi:Putative SOS response-associated peptidase YedK [Noviherbaspirillum humi]|uniref:Abasic site processing protein n=1 Tax=Noviherbaspirillum humi TaxID=1688639 RepID=A0A239C2I5_9BURK|nr:SOS response-associated peptidase family protein [Noviherbaspirillum humi]SNS14102.1 Putative SOS response-associated peptidase YedK [Noviherbaspirillum humi]
MCGRITQKASPADYARGLSWPDSVVSALPEVPIDNYNCTPGAGHWIMHCMEEAPAMRELPWGYRPSWGAEKNLPVAINARIENALTSAYFRGMWKNGRIIVPADGWYEWTGERGSKQPWYVRRRDGAPLYMAALTNFRLDKELSEDGGFVLVTASAGGGMVDIHDRRPVVLAPEDAQLWMDAGFSKEQAEHMARYFALPPDSFEWYEVSTEVNKVGRSTPRMIEPLHAH